MENAPTAPPVLEVRKLSKSFGGLKVASDVSFSIRQGELSAIIGPNGAGKTTLARLISEREQPDAGTLTIGDTVKLAYVDQTRDALDGEKTVWEEISGGLDTIELEERN